MFLSKLARRGPDDSGMALVAVIALAAVTAVIGVTVGAVTVRSLETTNGVAASVEARAAAQAGIAYAENELRKLTPAGDGACPSGATLDEVDAGAPNTDFLVEIYPDNGAGGWSAVPTCPVPTTVQIKVVSTGFADRSVSGAGEGEDEVALEATFQYIPRYVEVPDIDPAVYAYSIDGVLKKFVLDSADLSISADVQIKTGNFECTNNASVAGDVILADGAADLTSCTINGTLHVTKGAGIDGGSLVTGDVIAGGATVTGTNPTLRLEANSRVNGSAFTGGNVTIGGSRVIGNITATRDTSTTVSVGSGSTVGGNVLSSGTIQRVGTISGTQSPGVVGLQTPTAPRVPDWTDIPWNVTNATQFQATSWYQQGFVNRVVWTGTCTMGNGDPRWAALSLYIVPTVIDATGCVGGVTTNNNLKPDVVLSTNIVFIADKFTFNKLYFASSLPTVNRKLYFIVPDNTPNALPTCSGEAGPIYLTNEADLRPTVSAFIYSPCEIKSDRNGLRGQLYGGVIDFDQQAQMTYVPTTPPGVDLSASLPPALALSGAYMGDQISIREVNTGG